MLMIRFSFAGTPNKYRWALVGCGGAHTLAYSQQLGLFGWGRSEGGALGMGTIPINRD